MRTTVGSSGAATQRRACFSGPRLPTRVVVHPRVASRSAAGPSPVAISAFDDEVKEQSRKYRRTVFGIENWEAHRSANRYNRHLIGMFSSRVVWGLTRPLLYTVGISSAVVTYETLRQHGVLPEGLPSIQLNTKEPFGLTSFALSLLLVFRTNASYGRWDEARKMWGLILNRSRDIVRQGLTYIPPEKPDLREALCRWTPAFSRSLMIHLRKGDDIEETFKGVLLPHEFEALMKSEHRPNYCLQVLGQIVASSNAGVAGTIRMDDNLTAFEDCLGGCERILKTPIPLSYTRHTSRFLIIWLTLLPFALYGTCGFTTIPLSVLIAFLLLGIEEIGVSIEEPFSILALEAICGSALNNVRELEATHNVRGLPAVSSASADGAAAAADSKPLPASEILRIAQGDKTSDVTSSAAQVIANGTNGRGLAAAGVNGNGTRRAGYATISFRN